MKYILEDVNFDVNDKSCGHETIKKCLDYSYENHYSSAELFLLTGGLEFDFLYIDNKTLGYNSLKPVAKSLKTHLTENIEFYEKKTFYEKIELIEQNVKNGNLASLYIMAEGLIYQDFKEKRYPYHMINVYGIDTYTEEIYIADLYVMDNKPARTIIGKFPWEIIINNVEEILVYKKDQKQILKNIYTNEIIDNLKKMVATKFSVINDYFMGLNRIDDFSYKINSITSTRWLFIPLFEFIKEYSYNSLNDYLKEKIENLIVNWKNILLKYIKYCIAEINCDIYEKLNIALLLSESQDVLEKIVITQEKMLQARINN